VFMFAYNVLQKKKMFAYNVLSIKDDEMLLLIQNCTRKTKMYWLNAAMVVSL
jgi:hypothetical protein